MESAQEEAQRRSQAILEEAQKGADAIRERAESAALLEKRDGLLRCKQQLIREALGQETLSYDLRIRYICPACREQEKDNIMEEKHHER